MTNTDATHRYDAFGIAFNCRVLGDYGAGDPDTEVVVEVTEESHSWHGRTLAAEGRHLTAL